MIDDKISSTPPIGVPPHEMAQGSGGRQNGHREQDSGPDDAPDEVMKHFDELKTLVEQANFRLEEGKSPLRFILNREGESIIIDIVRLSATGGPVTVLHKNITHERFKEAVKHILKGEGLIIDTLG